MRVGFPKRPEATNNYTRVVLAKLQEALVASGMHTPPFSTGVDRRIAGSHDVLSA
jgi:hypothetical protein